MKNKSLIMIAYFLLMMMNLFAILGVGLAHYQAHEEINNAVIVWFFLSAVCFLVIASAINNYFDILDLIKSRNEIEKQN